MNNTLSALVRWSAIGGLCLSLAILIPVTWILKKLTGGGLWIAEHAKAELKRQWGRA